MFYLGYLQEYGYDAYRNRDNLKTAEVAKPTLACHFMVVQLIGLSPFQSVQQAWECFTSVITTYVWLGKQGPSKSGWFQGFPESLICLIIS